MTTPGEWVSGLRSDDPAKRLAAAEYFSTAGDAVWGALPELLDALQFEDEAAEYAVAALEEAGAPPVESLAIVESRLNGPGELTAYWSATLLGRAESNAVSSIPALCQLITENKHSAATERGVWAIGRIGATTPEAIAVLQQCTKSSSPRMVRLATTALQPVKS